ncbi:hypothetical protein HG263_02950 [Pseudoalteromonas sp. JBTF-M23]|uniref:Uncharacterized protein n=1 Tax=Pseudoalteromonas caenipelagi TaxID=2726988 RepID=A0A849V8G4_9GAMM|nr:hypothetical protein [Pseudoalteromonas caenipelagi]NOU49506.1 hypothetical protein [Pseudoalteromonas caenipelagi]
MTVLTDKIASNNFVNGEFPNAASQLLPWPESTFRNPLSSLDVALDMAIPNEHDLNGGYLVISATNITYFNSDNIAQWTWNVRDYLSSYRFYYTDLDDFKFPNLIYNKNGVSYLITALHENGNSHFRLLRVNLNDRTYVLSSDTLSVVQISLGILENNTLFCTHEFATYSIDFDTMKFQSRLYTNYIGPLSHSRNNNSPVYLEGVSLFNGSVTLGPSFVGSSGGDARFSYDVCSIPFSVNRNFNTTNGESSKCIVRTTHNLSFNSFSGPLVQISKDLFMSIGSKKRYSIWSVTDNRRIYFTRSALECWASDCIYAFSGARLGV